MILVSQKLAIVVQVAFFHTPQHNTLIAKSQDTVPHKNVKKTEQRNQIFKLNSHFLKYSEYPLLGEIYVHTYHKSYIYRGLHLQQKMSFFRRLLCRSGSGQSSTKVLCRYISYGTPKKFFFGFIFSFSEPTVTYILKMTTMMMDQSIIKSQVMQT